MGVTLGDPGYLGLVPERNEADSDEFLIEQGRTFHYLAWSLIGNELPTTAHERILGPIDRLGDSRERSEESIRRAQRGDASF